MGYSFNNTYLPNTALESQFQATVVVVKSQFSSSCNCLLWKNVLQHKYSNIPNLFHQMLNFLHRQNHRVNNLQMNAQKYNHNYDQLTNCKDSHFWKLFSYIILHTASIATLVIFLYIYNMQTLSISVKMFVTIWKISSIFLPLKLKAISSCFNSKGYVRTSRYWLVSWVFSDFRGINCSNKNSIKNWCDLLQEKCKEDKWTFLQKHYFKAKCELNTIQKKDTRHNLLTDCKESRFWKLFSYIILHTASIATLVIFLHIYNMQTLSISVKMFVIIWKISSIFLPLKQKAISSCVDSKLYICTSRYWLAFWLFSDLWGINCMDK